MLNSPSLFGFITAFVEQSFYRMEVPAHLPHNFGRVAERLWRRFLRNPGAQSFAELFSASPSLSAFKNVLDCESISFAPSENIFSYEIITPIDYRLFVKLLASAELSLHWNYSTSLYQDNIHSDERQLHFTQSWRQLQDVLSGFEENRSHPNSISSDLYELLLVYSKLFEWLGLGYIQDRLTLASITFPKLASTGPSIPVQTLLWIRDVTNGPLNLAYNSSLAEDERIEASLQLYAGLVEDLRQKPALSRSVISQFLKLEDRLLWPSILTILPADYLQKNSVYNSDVLELQNILRNFHSDVRKAYGEERAKTTLEGLLTQMAGLLSDDLQIVSTSGNIRNLLSDPQNADMESTSSAAAESRNNNRRVLQARVLGEREKPEDLLNQKEAAAAINRNTSTIKRWENQGYLTNYGEKYQPLYSEKELIQENEKAPARRKLKR